MRRPLRAGPPLAAVNRTASTPAPIAGWNARDPISQMQPDQALVLDNLFPEVNRVKLRNGFTEHVSGLTNAVESLMPYHPATGTSKLFAAANSAVYEVTTSVGAAEFSSLTNTRFQHTEFGNSAGQYLYICNGADAPRYYNGTSWTSPTITGSGLTATDLIHVNAFKRRLFFIEKDTLSFWYLPVETISGAITEFDLSGYAALGGHLVAMGTWSRDAGDGIDDFAVFLTSEGEALIYQGSDPGDATDWALVGVFRVGAPLGRRCMFKVGSELVLLTEDGFQPISRALAMARTSNRAAISDNIVSAVNEAARAYGSNFGWQGLLYPRGRWALFNVPLTEGTKSHQYIANTSTGAWCRFTGLNANCWAVWDDNVYFGGNAAVYQADTGQDDNGSDIEFAAQTAFTYFGSAGTQKRYTMVRPVIATEGTMDFALEANTDFDTSVPTETPTYAGGSGSAWDVATWDVDLWGGGLSVQTDWQSVAGVGHSVALYLKGAAQDLSLDWYSVDWSYEIGGTL